MKITTEWLEKKGACFPGVEWFCKQKNTSSSGVIKALMREDEFDWANWLIVRVLSKKQCVAYAIFAAEQVIGIFEKEFQGGKSPRKAIEAAKAVFKKRNKRAAPAARYAACATYHAWEALVAGSASRAVRAAYDAAIDASLAAWDSDAAMESKIIKFGLSLLEKKKGKK
jgi:hypothetical protein